MSRSLKLAQEKPLISVLMPVHNAEQFLSEAIDSIRWQTYRNWELIAVDDGSKDASWEILEKYAKKDKRIRIFRINRNKGLSHALNKALEEAIEQLLQSVVKDDEKITLFRKSSKEILHNFESTEQVS